MTTSSKLPVFRGHIPVEGIPWDRVNELCDRGQDTPPLIPGEFTGNAISTVQLLMRLDFEPWAENYRKQILEIVRPFLYWTDKVDYDVISQGAWVNRYRHGGRAEWHTHIGYVDLVVVWYLNATSDMGRFIVRYEGQDTAIDVNTGDVLVFPGTLLHSTETNMTDHERFIMANNICLTRDTIRQLSRMKIYNEDKFNEVYNSRQDGIYELLKNATNIT